MKLWRKRSSSRGATGGWWTEGGATGAVAVYQPIGAASLAASYTDLSGNGNDAAPVVAPTWASGTGWTFNGSTQWLDSGIIPASGYSMIVRFSGATTNSFAIAASYSGDDTSRLALLSSVSTTQLVFESGNSISLVPQGVASGVMAVADTRGYLDGVEKTAALTGITTAATFTVGIGKQNGFTTFFNGSVQAIAIYNTALTADQVAAISTAMAAL